ncbi:hypothetical protein ACLBXJ_26755 [Methylobacterium mesophilicum]
MSSTCIFTPTPGALACFNCTAWRPWGDMGVSYEMPGGRTVIGRRPSGQCRAGVPTIDPDAIGSENATWPVVGADDWCRQFEPARSGEHGEAA